MRTRAAKAVELPIVTLGIRNEADLVLVRQRARLVAELLGFGAVDQTRIATAVSEIARNALRHGGGGRARVLLTGAPQALEILIEDSGPGFQPGEEPAEPHATRAGAHGRGILLARRLMDDFRVGENPGGGAAVRLAKRLPPRRPSLSHREVAALVDELLLRPPGSLLEELQQQHQELLTVLEDLTVQQEALRATNAELEETNRGVMALYADVARELDDTNRGVMALYAQLDDQASELRGLNALKDRFLSHLSHEFRTPLNAALALSRLLLDRVDGPLTAEQEVQVRFIHDGAGELLEMVNDLLDLAKIEAGRMETRTEEVELAELLGALRGMFRPLAAAAGLELRIDEAPPELPVIWTDEGKLSQVLRNLLANAVKYTEHGEVRLTTEREGDFAVFSVSDTGVGIPAGELERIFEDFVQGGGRPRGAPGTGLGLSLARELAGLLGGAIQAESQEGAGSTFRLRIPVGAAPTAVEEASLEAGEAGEAGPAAAALPAARSPAAASPAEEAPQRASGRAAGKRPAARADESAGATVLVIDDDASSRYLVAHMIAPSGCTVIHAGTAQEGLEQARRLGPDAIFLDLGLPDRSGFQVLTELKRDPATVEVPIIVYTSRELDEHQARALTGFALRIVRKSDPALASSIAGIGDALVRSVARLPLGDDS